MTEIDGKVIPVEVKSGKDYRKHKALDHLLALEEYEIPGAVVLSPNNLEEEGKILYCPIYMASLLRNSQPASDRIDLHIF